MTITIYYSNKLECLKKILMELLATPTMNNPLYSEIILSENRAMREWLYIQLSEYFSVFANIKFYSSFEFIWDIFNRSLWGMFPESVGSHSTMSWVFMKILSDIVNKKYPINNCSVINRYLDDDINDLKCLQLSERMKNLFVQYFIYHPNWLLQWQRGQVIEELDVHTQSWQSTLWRLFLKEVSNQTSFFYFQHSTYEYIINFLKQRNIRNKLPKRIFIYGISYFPPILLEILQALGEYVNIYIFSINPCRFFLKKHLNYFNVINILRKPSQLFQCFSSIGSWNIFNRKNFLSTQNKVPYNGMGNVLLSCWGCRFQEVFYSLLSLKIIFENNFFVENMNNSSLLHMLQNDILNDYSQNIFSEDTMLSIKNIKDRLLSSSDRSLSVHICYNIQREIEVLYDRILGMMSDDPLLLPHEIIVMAPNIDHYVSAIRAVFNSSSMYGRYLPFTIFDSSINNINTITSSFLKLLNLSYIKFSIDDVLELLSIPALSLRFDIDADGVKLLSTWILESGIRWGLDDDFFSDITMCSNSNTQHTWEFGITRMLLSYAIDSAHGLWNNILPYDINNSISFLDLVGQLSHFLVKLKYWRNRLLKTNVLLKEWLSLSEEIINDFYVTNYDVETELTLIDLKNHWRKIIHSGMEANYDYPISINILYNKLYDRLHYQKKVKNRFCYGGIIFCNLSSSRSIPFKVVYLLGMNINVYPKNNQVSHNFDLMKNEVRFDDCHAWCNDRYLFLEILLSAREKLNISFIGDSIPNRIKFFSSILIDELFEYIIHNFVYIEKSTRKIVAISMDWIYCNLCYWHPHLPFSLKNFISQNKNQSFFKEWLPIFCKNLSLDKRKFLSPLSSISISSVSFDSLCNFYVHPVRAWFQNRLKIYIHNMLEFSVDEPFFVETCIKYRICKDLIFAFLNNQDVDVLYNRIRCSGMLPYGNFGQIFWIKQCEAMMKLSKIISVYYLSTERSNLPFFLNFNNNIQLHGILNGVQSNGLLRWKPGALSMRDGLSLWLEHLVYCALGGEGDSWMFGVNSHWHFIALSHVEAKEYLFFLISGYSHGLTIPLLLFSHSGGSWLRHCFDVKKKSISLDLNCQFEARGKLIIAWEGNQYVHGDSADPYIKKLIPKLLDENIESIIASSKRYFLLPMKFNVPIN